MALKSATGSYPLSFETESDRQNFENIINNIKLPEFIKQLSTSIIYRHIPSSNLKDHSIPKSVRFSRGMLTEINHCISRLPGILSRMSFSEFIKMSAAIGCWVLCHLDPDVRRAKTMDREYRMKLEIENDLYKQERQEEHEKLKRQVMDSNLPKDKKVAHLRNLIEMIERDDK